MHTMFPGDHGNQGVGFWGAKVKNDEDKAHKEVMRKFRQKEAVTYGAMEGMAVGALPTVAAALGTYGASRRRRTPADVPPRAVAHPAMPGWGVGGGGAAPAA